MNATNDNELPRSRAEAKASNSVHYFTGKPCKYGHVDRRYSDDGRCMECSRVKALKRYYDNQGEMNAKAKERNKVKYAEDRKYRAAKKLYSRERRRDPIHGERKRQYDRDYRARMTEADREKKREYERKYQFNRHANSPKARIDRAMSGGIYKSLKGMKNGSPWETLAGYSLAKLMRHLERKFEPGMTWDNYGRGGWHNMLQPPSAPAQATRSSAPTMARPSRAPTAMRGRPAWVTSAARTPLPQPPASAPA